MVFEPRALPVNCRGGEFALQSVCMVTTLQWSLVLQPVYGGQLSCTVQCRF